MNETCELLLSSTAIVDLNAAISIYSYITDAVGNNFIL